MMKCRWSDKEFEKDILYVREGFCVNKHNTLMSMFLVIYEKKCLEVISGNRLERRLED